MPTDLIHVDRVDQTMTDRRLPRWLVTGTYADGRLGAFQATTLSPFAASLCDVSKGGDALAIQWRDERFGKAITYVQRPDQSEVT